MVWAVVLVPFLLIQIFSERIFLLFSYPSRYIYCFGIPRLKPAASAIICDNKSIV